MSFNSDSNDRNSSEGSCSLQKRSAVGFEVEAWNTVESHGSPKDYILEFSKICLIADRSLGRDWLEGEVSLAQQMGDAKAHATGVRLSELVSLWKGDCFAPLVPVLRFPFAPLAPSE